MVDELVRFAAVRDGPHGELMDSDAFGSDGVEHGIAQPAVCIMIFDRQQSSMRCRRAFQQVVRSIGTMLYRSMTRTEMPVALSLS